MATSAGKKANPPPSTKPDFEEGDPRAELVGGKQALALALGDPHVELAKMVQRVNKLARWDAVCRKLEDEGQPQLPFEKYVELRAIALMRVATDFSNKEIGELVGCSARVVENRKKHPYYPVVREQVEFTLEKLRKATTMLAASAEFEPAMVEKALDTVIAGDGRTAMAAAQQFIDRQSAKVAREVHVRQGFLDMKMPQDLLAALDTLRGRLGSGRLVIEEGEIVDAEAVPAPEPQEKTEPSGT